MSSPHPHKHVSANGRKIIETLALQGQMSSTQIASKFSITAQAISQHLKILRQSQVIHMDKRAQQRLYRINPDSLREIESWARQYVQLWEARFDAIDRILADEEDLKLIDKDQEK
jgi:predicted transcriptional regulator